jgi:nitrous oxidase accessory protein
VNASLGLGSARVSRAGDGVLAITNFPARARRRRKSLLRRDNATSTRHACATLRLAIAPCLTSPATAATLQERINVARPNDTIHVETGVHAGAIVINKPLTLIGEEGGEIRGNGSGKVVTIAAAGVTIVNLRITGSGLDLMQDDAAIFVLGNRATIEKNTIANSLHGIYLKKVSGARILENRIEGKTTIAASAEPIEKGIGQSAENCDTTLVANRRGNGIHQWNCEGNLIRGNEISEARDGIYFSFTNHSRVENNRVHHVRYGLHYMYSDNNIFENNTFTENAAGAAIMFSKELLVRGNRFISNRGFRAYGLIVQSTDGSRFERNEIEQNAVGLSFNQCIGNRVTGNRVRDNYIGLKFGSNSDANQFSENVFTRNLHPVESGLAEGDGNNWAVHGVGNFWDDGAEIDLNHDGIGELSHREIDLFGVLRRDFPAVAFLSGSPAVKLLRYANERAAVPGVSSIDDPAPLTAQFWKIRAQRLAQTALPNE